MNKEKLEYTKYKLEQANIFLFITEAKVDILTSVLFDSLEDIESTMYYNHKIQKKLNKIHNELYNCYKIIRKLGNENKEKIDKIKDKLNVKQDK